MLVLRWMYTGRSPAEPLEGSGGAGNGVAGTQAAAEVAQQQMTAMDLSDTLGESPGDVASDGEMSRVLGAMVAADALGIDGLTAACGVWLARLVDGENALEILALSEEMHCDRLRAHCLKWLHWRFGAWRRRSRPATYFLYNGAAGASLVPEAVDAMELSSLDGFDRLSERARRDLVWSVGLPPAALAGTADDIDEAIEQAQAASRAARPITLEPGMFALIKGVSSRTELNGLTCKLVELTVSSDAPLGRWTCYVEGSGERLRIKPSNLDGDALVVPVWWDQELK